MIIQGTETLTSILHIISESLLTPVVVLLVVFVVLVILFLGGFINEAISRKSIKKGKKQQKEEKNSIEVNATKLNHNGEGEFADHSLGVPSQDDPENNQRLESIGDDGFGSKPLKSIEVGDSYLSGKSQDSLKAPLIDDDSNPTTFIPQYPNQ